MLRSGVSEKAKQGVRRRAFGLLLAGSCLVAAGMAIGQESQRESQPTAQQRSYQHMTPQQRAEATREFLGLGPEPDRAAAARGAPLFSRNCAFCHGAEARGATAPSLITSDVVLGDDHGEHLAPFLKKGRPEKGMPAFATVSDDQLRDIAEYLHLQVEDVANRGTYRLLNIVVGNAARGKAWVGSQCMSCHTEETFAHIASRFRSPEQLQRGWIWPSRSSASAVTAAVKMPDGSVVAGRVAQVSDFRITLVDSEGRAHAIERKPAVEVQMHDPLAAHQAMIMTLTNEEMHDVTAYLETLR